MRLAIAGLVALMALSATSVLTAENVVSPSRASQQDDPISPNDLKPAECAAQSLTELVTGSGTVTGTDAADLLVAGSGGDTLDGGAGGDCLLGGGGDDSIKGSAGDDVCIGGPGSDTFEPDCETTYQ